MYKQNKWSDIKKLLEKKNKGNYIYSIREIAEMKGVTTQAIYLQCKKYKFVRK